MPRIVFALTAIGFALSSAPVAAQAPSEPPAYETQLRGLTAEESLDLIATIQDAQSALRRGEKLYFQLVSGAPASYPMTATSPRDAFLGADFSRPFDVERRPADNPSWKRHRLTLVPNGVGNLLWDVEVVLGFSDQIERIEMFYRPPHPF